ncbi:MAG: nucleotidyltransferase domain-containing protein [Candidatus Helarchaeota archaeon]
MNKIFQINQKKKNEILEKIKIELNKRKEIIFGYIYGSFIYFEKFHDIDIGIYVDKAQIDPKTDFIDYEINLSTELELKINFPIDVKVINDAPLYFQFNVINGQLISCKNDELLGSFIEKTVYNYLNLKPYYMDLFKFIFNIK